MRQQISLSCVEFRPPFFEGGGEIFTPPQNRLPINKIYIVTKNNGHHAKHPPECYP